MKEKEPKPQLFSMAAFDVKTTSEEGIRVEVTLPDGTETANFLTVRGADSPTFRKAQARNNRELLALQKKAQSLEPADLAMRQAKLNRELVAVLVTGWNMPTEDGEGVEECTIETVSAFFEKAPQLMEQVDQIAGQRKHFFNKPSQDSKPTQGKSSGSADLSKGAKSQTESTSQE